jgi:MFS family permease
MPIYIVFALNVCNTTSQFANRVVLALLALQLGASPIAVGVVGGLFSLCPTFLGLFAGRVADRFGTRQLLIWGTVSLSVGMLSPYFWMSIPAIMIAATLCGLSQVLFNVSTQNLTGLLSTSETRPRNFSNYALTNSTGQFVGMLIGGFTTDHLSNTTTCLSLAVFAAIPLVILAIRRQPLEPANLASTKKSATKDITSDNTSAWLMLKDPIIRQTLYTGSLMNSGLNLYQFYLPVYAHSIGISASVIGMIMAAHATAAFVVRIILPNLIKKLQEDNVLALAFFFGALAFLLIPFVHHAWILGILSFIFGLGMGVGQPIVTMQMFANSPKGRSGESIGLKMTTNQLTKMISPIAFGAIATGFGLFAMFGVNALLLISGGLLSKPSLKKINQKTN